jgi:hypothetical protein
MSAEGERREYMGRGRQGVLWVALALVLVALLTGACAGGGQQGTPQTSEDQWSIGIYRGANPFHFGALQRWINPRFTAKDVTDISAAFVADPFLIREGQTWYLFLEAFNKDTEQGDLAVATSSNTWIWKYQGVALDEPFPLSYPYVFKWQDRYYMIPESSATDSVRLYRSDAFPTRWTLVKTLLSGRAYVDSSIVFFHGKWWMFSSTTRNDVLYLHFADSPEGPWQEHPSSPLIMGNAHISRPGGRILVYQDKLYRFAQDDDPYYGKQIWAVEITELTPTRYQEKRAQAQVVLGPSGTGWNAFGMHQIDAEQVGAGSWIAAVDGNAAPP